MGHTRLGKIPTTRKWKHVVQTLSATNQDGEPTIAATRVEEIAADTLEAAQASLETASRDLGLRYTFFLLTQIALASRDNEWRVKLARLGVQLEEDDSILEFTSGFQGAIDEYLVEHRHSTDISEMAQQAAGEALTYLAGPGSVTLFGAGSAELKATVKGFSTKKGFSRLAQKFFGTFMARFINFYVSRATAAEVGNPSLPHLGELTRFNEALLLHCEQSARIIHDFSGQWFSKTEYLEGINLENATKFLAVALRKLQAELKAQEADI